MEEDGSNNSFHDARGSTKNPITEARLFRVNSGSDVELLGTSSSTNGRHKQKS
jgi:hypothetical protein